MELRCDCELYEPAAWTFGTCGLPSVPPPLPVDVTWFSRSGPKDVLFGIAMLGGFARWGVVFLPGVDITVEAQGGKGREIGGH